MTDQSQRATELAQLIGEIFNVEVDATKLDARLIDDYGADSMDMVDIAENMERRYGVKISNDSVTKLRTFGDVLNLLDFKPPA